jgi:hypothetical protein
MEQKTFWQKNKPTIIVAGIAVVLGIIYFSMSISYTNHANQLEVSAKEKIKANKVDYDAVWKIISQQAGVVDKYQESFKEIYIGLMEERYSDGQGQMMSWIQEHSPNFDATMFNNLMNTIEAQRTDFATRQKELIAIEEEYNHMLVTFPASWFVGDRELMDVTVVTSTKTEKVFDSGKEDDIELF